MKWFLILWATPILLLGSWYSLSYYDISFGFFMLSRAGHDLVFQVYGDILGLPPETIPPLVMRAIVVDSLVVFAFIAFRRRKAIGRFLQGGDHSSSDKALAREDSLSRAP